MRARTESPIRAVLGPKSRGCTFKRQLMEDFPSQHDMMYGQFACGAWSDDLLDFPTGSSDLDSQTWSSYMHSDFHVEQFLDAGISTWPSQPDFQWFLQAEAGEGCSECTPTVLSEVDQGEECGSHFIQQQINEFFQLGVGAADVRVEELADGSSGVLQGTKRVGGHGKDWRRSKEHHTYVVKRSLQRARKRAMQHGSTLYKGKPLTCQELGRPCDHYTTEVMQLGRRRTVHLRDEGKLDQILPAWPPTVGPLTEAKLVSSLLTWVASAKRAMTSSSSGHTLQLLSNMFTSSFYKKPGALAVSFPAMHGIGFSLALRSPKTRVLLCLSTSR